MATKNKYGSSSSFPCSRHGMPGTRSRELRSFDHEDPVNNYIISKWIVNKLFREKDLSFA